MKYIFLIIISLISCTDILGCTSAVISGKMTRDGRPILWKNRDTSHLINYISRTEATDSTHAFVALYNSEDIDSKEAWIGYNDAGFAIMNTASYNLKHPADTWKDREGYIMSEALARCSTVNDFKNLLQSLPRPLGVEANFGVIDAYGNGGFFETDDFDFRFFPLDDEHPVIVRTNFSVSGGEGGLGQVRYDTACRLLEPHVTAGDITPELLTDSLSRSFYYSPDNSDKSSVATVIDKDFLPRRSTSASIAVEGVNAPEDSNRMVMWTLMGYPPCGVTQPVTIDDIPSNLLRDKDGGCKASRDAQALKNSVLYKHRGTWRIKMPQLQRISRENRAKSLNNYNLYRNSHR